MNNTKLMIRAGACAVFLACLSLCGPVRAQSVTPSPQELNPSERVQAPPSESTAKGDLLSPPEAGPCPLRSSNLTFVLKKVMFSGAEAIDPDAFAPAYSHLVGQTVPVSAICDIRDRASEILFRKGYLARVEIPPQRIAQGELWLEVIEAYVAAVHVEGDVGPAAGKVAEYIEMLRGMRPFDIKKAQRYLYLASDVPGVRIAATLKPSPRGRGAVTLDIQVSRKPFNVLVNVQNSGSKETGPFGALARLDLNSFTSLGEHTSIVGYSTFQTNEQHVLQGVEEFRVGPEGLAFRVSTAWGVTRPGGDLKSLHLHGTSLVTEARFVWPALRSRRANFGVEGGMDIVEQSVKIGPSDRLTEDKLRIFTVRGFGSYAWRGDIPVMLTMDLELRQGVESLGSTRTGDMLASRIEGRPDGLVLRSNGTLDIRWADYVSTNIRYMAQYAPRPLLAYEEMPIGNLTIGRGYDPTVVSGDRGLAGAFEARLGPFEFVQGLQTGAMAFFDIAKAWNLDTGSLAVPTLKSLGGGVNFQLSHYAHLDLTYAHPMDKVSVLTGKRPPDLLLLNLTLSY